MIHKTTLAAGCLSTLLLCASAQANDFHGRWYFGLGGGASSIEPEVSAGPGRVPPTLLDTVDVASRIVIGRDLTNHFSAELFYTDLGDLTLDLGTGGESSEDAPYIGFQVAGAHLLYYLFNSDGADGRHYRDNLAAYVKLGVGAMENDGNFPAEKIDDVLMIYGFGLEGLIGAGTSWRAEVEAFDKSTMLGSLSLVKRFGGLAAAPKAVAKDQPAEAEQVVEEPVLAQAETDIQAMESSDKLLAEQVPVLGAEQLPEAAITDESSLAAVVGQLETLTPGSDGASMSEDSDSDGIVDAQDRCPGTVSGLAVDARGCSFSGIIEGLYFDRGSSSLSGSAKSVLDNVVLELLRFPNVVLEVQAHTDNRGKASDNLSLSQERAEAVANHMINGGISANRIRARGFGESRPAFRNATEEGRRHNRRVVFQTVEKVQ